jgi:hypothetical protein
VKLGKLARQRRVEAFVQISITVAQSQKPLVRLAFPRARILIVALALAVAALIFRLDVVLTIRVLWTD